MTYLKRLVSMKTCTLPSPLDAWLWSDVRMGGGPMSIADYESHLSFSDVESADHLLTLKARTAIGWFAISCYRWLTFWDLATYEANRDAPCWD